MVSYRGRSDDEAFGAIKALLAEGHSPSAVAKKLNVSRTKVHLVKKEKRCPSKRARAARAGKLSAAQEKRMLGFADAKVWLTGTKEMKTMTKKRRYQDFKYPSLSAIHGAAIRAGMQCSRSTVRNVLLRHGYTTAAIKVNPLLTADAKKRRLKFVLKGLKAEELVFSDETTIDSNSRRGSAWVKKVRGKKPRTVSRPAETRPDAVSCWAAVGIGFKTPISFITMRRDKRPDEERRVGLTSSRYIRLCLAPNAAALARSGKIFMQDGHKAHTAGKTYRYLGSKKIRVLIDWPANSCDLNPIEKLWNLLKARVKRRGPWGINQLKRYITEEWDAISQDEIDRHVRHFDTACRSCKRRRGAN